MNNLLAKIQITADSSDDDIKKVFKTEAENLSLEQNRRTNKLGELTDDELKKYTEEFSPYPFFLYAYKNKASDIAFVAYPYGNGKKNDNSRVFMRIDGVWEEEFQFNRELHSQYINAVKNWAVKGSGNTKTENQRIPQDGKARFCLFNKNKEVEKIIELRLAFSPQHVTDSRNTPLETCTIRLADSGTRLPLEKSGFSIMDLKKLKKLENLKKGLVLISGPTGSGKSSTLFGFIDKINDGSKRIYTLENPVEIDVPGISQFEVQSIEDISDDDEVTYNFTRAEQFLMRAAPDVILVGEIRSYQTGKTAVTLAGTGHVSMGTVHTNNAIQTMERLFSFKSKDGDKIDKLSILDGLEYVSSQMLSPQLCPHCKIKVKDISTDTGDKVIDNLNRQLLEDIESQKPFIFREFGRENMIKLFSSKVCSKEFVEGLIKESYVPNYNGCEFCSTRRIKTNDDGVEYLAPPNNRVGFKGRMLINETLLFDNYVKNLFLQGTHSNPELLSILVDVRPKIAVGQPGELTSSDLEKHYFTMYQDALMKALLPSKLLLQIFPSFKEGDQGIISVLDAKKYGYTEI